MLCCNRELTKIKGMDGYFLMICSCCGNIFHRIDIKVIQEKVRKEKDMNNQGCKIGRQWVAPLYRYDEIIERNKQFLKRRKSSVIAQRYKVICNNGQPLVQS